MLTNGTARKEDINGWVEIQGNPLSKVGVFPYFGFQIDPSLIPDKIYNVLRPEEELSHPECISSFRLIPWTDEHTMLGEGGLPAEHKGVAGVIGENVYYDAPYLKANIKIFSESLANLIENGKKELSIGYRCLYELTPGVYNGQQYEAIQRGIRGNHVALVIEGRAGPDVAVLDSFKFTLDEAIMDKLKNKKVTSAADEGEEGAKTETETSSTDEETSSTTSDLEKITEMLAKIKEPLTKFMELIGTFNPAAASTAAQVDDEDPSMTTATTTDKDPSATAATMDAKLKDFGTKIANLERQNKELKTNVFKSFINEVTERDNLVNKLSPIIGVFDHKAMTLEDVAKYGVKHLGLECDAGQEAVLLRGYLAAKQPDVAKTPAVTTDESNISPLRKHLSTVK